MCWVGESSGRWDIRLGRCLCAWTGNSVRFFARRKEKRVRSMHPMVVHLHGVRAEREATVVGFQSRLFCAVVV
jgi:hypothetical protein